MIDPGLKNLIEMFPDEKDLFLVKDWINDKSNVPTINGRQYLWTNWMHHIKLNKPYFKSINWFEQNGIDLNRES